MGLELASYGYAGRAESVAAPEGVKSDVEQVAYAWDERLEEWFVNDARGLEHGFTLRSAPEGPGAVLELNLRVRGGLVARSNGGRSVRFVNAATAKRTASTRWRRSAWLETSRMSRRAPASSASRAKRASSSP